MLRCFRCLRHALLSLAGFIAFTFSVPSPALEAQTIFAGSSWTRDDIPATILRNEASFLVQPGSALYLGAGYRHLFADQAEFNGIPALRETLHTAYALASAILGGPFLIADLRGGMNVAPDGEKDFDGSLRLRSRIATGPASRINLALETGRRRELSVTTAIHERVSLREIAGNVEVELVDRLSAALHASRHRYNDGNTRRTAYGYGLVDVARAPKVSLGYAYSYDDSDRDNWRLTGTTFGTGGRYTYHYFYYPYFTPMEERGHSVLGVVRWTFPGGGAFGMRATVPVRSQGLVQATQDPGLTPLPPAATYQTATGILPLQYHADLSVPMHTRLLAGVRYEYFRKPYYSYQTAGLSLRLTF